MQVHKLLVARELPKNYPGTVHRGAARRGCAMIAASGWWNL